MSEYLIDGYHSDRPAAFALPSERVAFIRRTYAHLAGAILAFMGIEALFLNALNLDQQAAILRANGYFRVAAAVEATARDERDDILAAIANTERDDA